MTCSASRCTKPATPSASRTTPSTKTRSCTPATSARAPGWIAWTSPTCRRSTAHAHPTPSMRRRLYGADYLHLSAVLRCWCRAVAGAGHVEHHQPSEHVHRVGDDADRAVGRFTRSALQLPLPGESRVRRRCRLLQVPGTFPTI